MAFSTQGSDMSEQLAHNSAGPGERPRGLWDDAWDELKRRPIFWISAFLIVLFILMAAFPGLFTRIDPNAADLSRSMEAPSSKHWFGLGRQGRDVCARRTQCARGPTTGGPSPALVTARDRGA